MAIWTNTADFENIRGTIVAGDKVVLDDGETTFDLMLDKKGNIIGKEEDYL